MNERVGKPIAAWDAVTKSAGLISRTPTIMLPLAIVLILSLLGDVVSAGSLSALGIVISIVSFVVSIIVTGSFPSMVQTVLGGGQISVADSMRKAYQKFWTLLFAGILVGIIVALGFVALVVPGIIFVTWYAYTVPAIMLKDKGVLAGMGASKAFGRDKKWSTFSICVIIGVVFVIAFAIQSALSLASPIAGRVVYSFLSVPLDAWIAVVFTYTYITYGPSSVPATAEVPSYGVVPPPVQQPSAPINPIADTSPQKNFCRFCGSPIQPDSRFCSACGAVV